MRLAETIYLSDIERALDENADCRFARRVKDAGDATVTHGPGVEVYSSERTAFADLPDDTRLIYERAAAQVEDGWKERLGIR